MAKRRNFSSDFKAKVGELVVERDFLSKAFER